MCDNKQAQHNHNNDKNEIIKIKAEKAIGLISNKNFENPAHFLSFLCRHYTTNIAKLDWNGNCVILALISNIVASSVVMLVTFISVEIHIQRINHRLAKILETVFGIVNQNNKDLNTCEVPVGL